MLEITCCYIVLHLNLKQLRFTGEQSHQNVIESFAMSCDVQSYQDLKHEP